MVFLVVCLSQWLTFNDDAFLIGAEEGESFWIRLCVKDTGSVNSGWGF